MRRHFVVLLGTALSLASAAPAAGDATLFSDDAEGALDSKWVPNKPENPLIQPWQKSDSETPKFRGNQAHGGQTSYWAGVQPQDFHPTDITEGQATLTTKEPILIPADGTTTISAFSLFQNESDDEGRIEAALASAVNAKGAWKKLAEVVKPCGGLVPEPDPECYRPYCPPGAAVADGFVELKGTFDAFKGQLVYLRLNMLYGPGNPALSHPCGWYVDDINITTTGTPGKAPDPPAKTPAAPAAAKPGVTYGRLKASGKRAVLRLNVTGGPLRKVTVTLSKGSKRLATGKAASLAAGARKVTFKLRRKLPKGRYAVKLKATGPDGSPFSAVGKAKA